MTVSISSIHSMPDFQDESLVRPSSTVGPSGQVNSTPSATDPVSRETLSSLLMAYAPTQDPRIVDQYVEKLCALFSALREKGFDADDLRARMTEALRSKETGGYSNLACELAAAGHFLEHFPEGFRYQVPSGPPAAGVGTAKNFDFSFMVDNFSFNVEVKAFTPKAPGRQRPPQKQFLPPQVAQALYDVGHRFSSNCAPAIGRFLTDANTQLTRPSDGLSVMLLCCNDLDEFADALTCFVGPHGICYQAEQQGLVPAPSQLPNIDAVVICQLGFNQSAILDPGKFENFYGEDGISISDGAEAWNYARALPIALFLRGERPSLALQVEFEKAFQSRHADISNLMAMKGIDAQAALFHLFNMDLASRS